MIKEIRFQRDGIAFSDYIIQEVVDSFLNNEVDDTLITSTHLIIDEIRTRVKEKRINYTDIKVFIDREEWNFDEDGRSYDWKDSQRIHGRIITRLL